MSILEESSWLAYISSVPNIGRKTLTQILEFIDRYQLTIEQWMDDKRYHDPELSLSQKQLSSIELFINQYTYLEFCELLHENTIRIITEKDPEYPRLLLPLDDKPVLLFAKGHYFDQTKIPIAVVGSRKMTVYGRQATQSLIQELAQYPCVINSGFMYGLDMCAHTTAQKVGLPTVGILGYGFKHLYPNSFKKTMQQMLGNGMTLMTEFAPDVEPRPGNFPVRNRIVAGMSEATIVVEAGLKSGSLITAHCALEYGRIVGAVPGPIQSQYSEGTKWLVNQGAKLVTTAQDILEELYDQPLIAPTTIKRENIPIFISKTEKLIHDHLFIQKNIEDLAEIVTIPIEELHAIITSMEIRGLIRRKGAVVERV